MITLRFKDLNNTSKLKREAKKIAETNESLIDKAINKNYFLDERTYLGYLLHNVTLAGKTNKKQYSKAINRFIGYSVRINLSKEDFHYDINSKRYREIFEKRYKYKQGLIIVIESAMKKLPDFNSYLKEINKDGEELEFNPILNKNYEEAKKEFDELAIFYRTKPKKLLGILLDKYRPKKYTFSRSQTENAALIKLARKMMVAEEKRNLEAYERINNYSSLAKYLGKKGLQRLGINQLEKLLSLIKQYVKEFHINELMKEEKEASRLSSMKNLMKDNPRYITREDKKRVVLELSNYITDYKELSENLKDTPYEASRQTVSKWIRESC